MNGQLVDSCQEGQPTGADNDCDGIDQDCDGIADDGYVPTATTCGVGACEGNTGIETCTAGVWGGDTCEPLAGATDEVCDNIDNNCNGDIDENLGTSPTT